MCRTCPPPCPPCGSWTALTLPFPHKSAILPFLDSLDAKARRFGSVNTVRVEAGRMTGFTTDGAGCQKALENHGLDFSGRLLLLGNGGAARALAFEAADRQRDVDLTIACRENSQPKAVALAQEVAAFLRERGDRMFRLTVQTYEELESFCRWEGRSFDLLLNATSVGMYPREGASPVSRQVVSRCGAVFDAVYNPAQTELLRLAEETGAQTVGGMEMLVYQAVAAHEIWYGTRFSQEDLRTLCRDAQEELTRPFSGNGVQEGGTAVSETEKRRAPAQAAGQKARGSVWPSLPELGTTSRFREILCSAALWAAENPAWAGAWPSC